MIDQKDRWVSLDVKIEMKHLELVMDRAMALGATGILEKEAEFQVSYPHDDHGLEAVANLEDFLKSKHPGAQVRKTIVERENWNQEWQNFFKPVIISDKTVVLPEWENPTAFDQAIQTRIRPAMAFGTGTHETTQLCLKLLESAVKNGDVILDLGTGSGILGITALHLGASHVDGIDNDANVAENTLDNIKLNQVEDKFRLLISENPQLSSTYDLLLVNMIKARLLPILPRYFEQVNRGGIVIVSGLLQSEDEEFRAIISGSSWIITDKIKMNEWIAYRCDVE